jgi:hypothetical protein
MILELIVEHLPEYPGTVFCLYGVLLPGEAAAL